MQVIAITVHLVAALGRLRPQQKSNKLMLGNKYIFISNPVKCMHINYKRYYTLYIDSDILIINIYPNSFTYRINNERYLLALSINWLIPWSLSISILGPFTFIYIACHYLGWLCSNNSICTPLSISLIYKTRQLLNFTTKKVNLRR